MKINPRWKIAAVAIAMGAVLATSACSSQVGTSASTSQAPASNRILKVGWRADPVSLDPQRGSSGIEYSILYSMFDTLIGLDQKTLQPVPGLAKSWDQSDPKTLILDLRKGVEFQDGTSFNADAVKFNFDRAKSASSKIASDVANIASVDVVNDYQVKINLTVADTSLLLTLADRAGMMVSPTAANAEGADFGKNPVGAGPFKFLSNEPGAAVKVRKWGGYWKKGQPYIGGIDFDIISDSSTAENAVRTGQQDIINYVPLQDVKTLQSVRTLNVTTTPSLVSNVFYLNTAFAPFDKVDVRRAVNMAIDRTALVKTTLFGLGEPAWTPFSSASWAYSKSIVPTYKYDPKAAKALLAKAGYPDGISFSLAIYNDPAQVRMAEVIKEQLAKAGMTVTIDTLELGQQTQLFLIDKKYGAGLSGGVVRPDPARTLATAFGQTTVYNPGHIAVPGLAEALDKANSTDNQADRKKYLVEAQEDIAKFAPFVPLDSPYAISVSSKKVQGFVPSLQDKPNFNTVRLSK